MTCSSRLLRHAALLLAVVGLSMLAGSCGDFFVSESSIQFVTVTPVAVLLEAGASPPDTFTFTSTVTTVGNKTSNDTATATWTSSNTSVATAASGGVVTAAASSGGQTTTIKATDGGQSGTATVFTYVGTAPGTLTLTFPNTITPTAVPRGTTFKVTATADVNGPNADISKFVTWTISNATATGVSVDTNGNVTVGATGTAGQFTVNAVAQFGAADSNATAPGSLTFTTI